MRQLILIVLLLSACAAQPEAAATLEPRIEPSIDVYYEPELIYRFDAGEGDLVTDEFSIAPLLITDPAAVTWVEGGLRLDAPVLITSQRAPAPVIDAIQRTWALTVIAWVEPANLTQNGPARIVTLSADSDNRNFMLGQGTHNGAGDFLEARLRTVNTDANGKPVLASPPGSLEADLMQIVYTYGRDMARLYIDGALVAESDAITGVTTNWNTGYRLALGDEFSGDRAWLGTYYHLEISPLELSAQGVQARFAEGLPD